MLSGLFSKATKQQPSKDEPQHVLDSIDARLKRLEQLQAHAAHAHAHAEDDDDEDEEDTVQQQQQQQLHRKSHAYYNKHKTAPRDTIEHKDSANSEPGSSTVRKLDSMFVNRPVEQMSLSLALLLDNNKLWASNKVRDDPGFFSRLERSQTPNYMWIGCSDSRVPANQIVSMPPGEIFVHRNVANLVYATDNNVMSVLQYAIENLRVRHVIVCGHACCGGVRAAFGPSLNYPLEGWLSSIRQLKGQLAPQLDLLKTEQERWDFLCEANVRAQVATLATLPVVQSAWARKQQLSLHGLYYSMENGILQDLNVSQPKHLADVFATVEQDAHTSPTLKQLLRRNGSMGG